MEEDRWEPPRSTVTPVSSPSPLRLERGDLPLWLLAVLRIVLAGVWLSAGLVPRLELALWLLLPLAVVLLAGGLFPRSPIPLAQRPLWLVDAAMLMLVLPVAAISFAVVTSARHSFLPSLWLALLPGFGMTVLVTAGLGVLVRIVDDPLERFQYALPVLTTIPLLLLGEPGRVSQFGVLAGIGTVVAGGLGLILPLFWSPLIASIGSIGLLALYCLSAFVLGSAPWRGIPPLLAFFQLAPIVACVLFILVTFWNEPLLLPRRLAKRRRH
ncbi:MAG: hypothetical protein IRY86_04975 [Thermorudis peleae]|nr:hypothetical protein [Thermorudis peleae]